MVLFRSGVLFVRSNMEPPRRFCSAYQLKRLTSGVTRCEYAARNCPHGQHACSECGKKGHGAQDCHLANPFPDSAPDPAQVEDQPPLPAASSSSATYVPGFGTKGEGKHANYGRVIEPPSIVSADLDDPLSQPSYKKAKQEVQRSALLLSSPPTPVYATTELVEEWLNESFRPLTGVSHKMPPEVGDSVLWRGLKTGKKGNPSTKVEYFNAKVRSVDVEADEIYCYVD